LRIKTIEKLISIEKTFNIITTILRSHFIISKNSYFSNSKLLIIGFNSKDFTAIVRGFLDKLRNRTYLTIVIYRIKPFLKFFSFSAINKDVIPFIGKSIIRLIDESSIEKVFFPFVKLPHIGQRSKINRLNIKKAEKEILNNILYEIYRVFNYKDVLIDYPFSIIKVSKTQEFWEEIYHPYLLSIENKLSKAYNNEIKIYKKYDFSRPNELFQRIIEMIIIDQNVNSSLLNQLKKNQLSEKDSKKELKENLENEKNLFITFVYCNKLLNKMKLIQVLKLSEQVKKFINLYKRKNVFKCKNIGVQIIFISLFGYEQNIENYVKKNHFKETEKVIPLFFSPPINNKIWHNFKDYKYKNTSEEIEKNKLKKIVKTYEHLSNHSHFKEIEIKKAEFKLNMMLQRENYAKIFKDTLKNWAHILNIEKSSEILNLSNIRNKIQKSLNKNEKFVKRKTRSRH